MSVWSYAGKRALVVGCHSGIGRATAEELTRLGAIVHGCDIADGPADIAAFSRCDMRDPGSIDAMLAQLAAPVDALFYCAGLPQTFAPIDVMKVNFIGARLLIERAEAHLAPGAAVATIASIAGNGWIGRAAEVTDFVETDGFDAGVAWYEARAAALGDPYAFSKEAMILWVMRRSSSLIRRGIRLNCLSPGPTTTAMMPAFESHGGAAVIDVFTRPIERRSTALEQAYPLIFLNSAAASFVNGLNLIADAGFTAMVGTGQLDIAAAMAQAGTAA